MLFYINSLPLNEQTNDTDCLRDLVLKLPVLIGVLVDLVSLHHNHISKQAKGHS